MERPAPNVMARSRALAALAVVMAVLVMHGLSCVEGDAHSAGVQFAAAAPGTDYAMSDHSGGCPGCHGSGHESTATRHETVAGVPMPALFGAGNSTEHDSHGGAECVAILAGLALLALLAAGVATTRRPVGGVPGQRMQVRPQPPTALLCPSLTRLCVLRT